MIKFLRKTLAEIVGHIWAGRGAGGEHKHCDPATDGMLRELDRRQS